MVWNAFISIALSFVVGAYAACAVLTHNANNAGIKTILTIINAFYLSDALILKHSAYACQSKNIFIEK